MPAEATGKFSSYRYYPGFVGVDVADSPVTTSSLHTFPGRRQRGAKPCVHTLRRRRAVFAY